MLQNMRKYPLYIATTSRNEFGEKIYNYDLETEIEIFISKSPSSLAEINQVWLIEATHVGVTYSKMPKIRDRIGDFEVLYTFPVGQYNYVYLKELKH